MSEARKSKAAKKARQLEVTEPIKPEAITKAKANGDAESNTTENIKEKDDLSRTCTELRVHRWRFSHWSPSAIVSIACTSVVSSSSFKSIVAVGREDGSITIQDPDHHFATRLFVAGTKDMFLQQLCWGKCKVDDSESPRLFGISLRGFIFEVLI
jgi:hypothetical protein